MRCTCWAVSSSPRRPPPCVSAKLNSFHFKAVFGRSRRFAWSDTGQGRSARGAERLLRSRRDGGQKKLFSDLHARQSHERRIALESAVDRRGWHLAAIGCPDTHPLQGGRRPLVDEEAASRAEAMRNLGKWMEKRGIEVSGPVGSNTRRAAALREEVGRAALADSRAAGRRHASRKD